MNARNTVVVLLLALAAPAGASGDYDRILALEPATATTCVAVEIATPPGQPLTGLRWLHNDASTPFPRLLIVEGEAGIPPEVDAPGLVLLELTGASLAWGDVDFGGPVTSSTGTAYAVFFYPTTTTTHAGTGGGPGIGLRESEGGPTAFISSDAAWWTRIAPGLEIGVEAKRALMRGGARVLALVRIPPAVRPPRPSLRS